MADETLTIKLSGAISLADYAEALARYERFVRALAAEVEGRTPLTVVIDGLEAGSAMTTVALSSPSPQLVVATVQRYHDMGQALARGEQLAGYNRQVQAAARKVAAITELRSVEGVRLESALGEAVLVRPDAAPTADSPQLRYSYGALRGRVEVLTRRRGLRFVLYDLLTDTPISCYLVAGQEERIRDTWGRVVLVRGEIGRDPLTWRPEVIRQIVDVVMLTEVEAASYRDLRGQVRPPLNALPPEARIRSLRDDEDDPPHLLG